MNYEYFMEIALKEAKKAFKNNEIPVGAVLISENGEILAKGYNKKEKKKDISSHAEIEVIKKASKKINSYHLANSIIFITLEPCLMCLEAIKEAQIKKIVFGAKDDNLPKYVETFKKDYAFNSKIEIIEGIKEKEAKDLLKEFFKNKR